MIETQEISKTYRLGDIKVRALRKVSLKIQDGEMVAIIGPSGSGKSTLLSILGCLDVPSKGVYLIDGKPVEGLNENQLAAIRREKIGFVFQQFNLLPRTTALENVMLPMYYSGVRPKMRLQNAMEALAAVGLSDRARSHPNQLSGGEQQRVAIARALVNKPTILLADEPTGNLDTQRGDEVMRIFQKLNRENGQTVVYVTHDPFIARHTNRIIQLVDGRIVSDELVADPFDAGTPRPDDLMTTHWGTVENDEEDA
ncbi:MAG: ABC transporter ATP-binding protein [Chloroflexi bacterium]|jgi:putative ABC transport system ATP-binding protein|nr:ABC transporter ATP-binding protein [Anaerolineaceae bacterium]NLI44518.1 ABC transporter ATP-binding protein [Chloroflexota bacterium]HOE34759.1 ABC transporter ATP-binding protein [Anaerolineaceae bacterium]HOT25334.1 ABC transporter ATP-binding protein [Anaerolineaceae bacterium]HQH57359.1 ABC transporter ATP-binding protein [Anaerolineaceae bacterium]